MCHVIIDMLAIKQFLQIHSRHDNIDIAIMRENTEGEYSGLEHEVFCTYYKPCVVICMVYLCVCVFVCVCMCACVCVLKVGTRL